MTADPRELVRAHLDGELDPESVRELGAWLESSPENVKAFVREAHLHHGLRQVFSLAETGSGTGDTTTVRKPGSRSRQRGAPRPRSKWHLVAAAALVTAAGLLIWMHLEGRGKVSTGLAPSVVSGRKAFLLSRGSREALPSGKQLEPGDRVLTESGGALILGYPDGSTLQLRGGTDLQLFADRRRKSLLLHEGAIYASVAVQPEGAALAVNAGRPDQAVVVGTEFELRRDGNTTVLSVERGRVRFGTHGSSVVCGPLRRSSVTGNSGPGAPERIPANEIAPWRRQRPEAGSGSVPPSEPISVKYDFEKADPFKMWTADGTYEVHSKGLSELNPCSGRKAFRIDVTLGTASRLLLHIPVEVPLEGKLRFSGRIRGHASSKEAEASLGLEVLLEPSGVSGVYQCRERVRGTAGSWLNPSLDDVVSMGRDKATYLLARYRPGQTVRETAIWGNKIGLFLDGPPGTRFTVWVDDVSLSGKAPGAAAYRRHKLRLRQQPSPDGPAERQPDQVW